MRGTLYRQLLALWAVALLWVNGPPGRTEELAPETAKDLQSAKLMEDSLAARSAAQEDWNRLLQTYADLAAKHPRDAAARNAHAELLWSLGRREEAEREWIEAERLAPKDPVILNHLGGCALANGEPQRAADSYGRASKAAPEVALYHFNFANVSYLFRHELLNAEQPTEAAVIKEAMRHYAEAARLAPMNPDYVRGYAETFYGIPDPDWSAALSAWEHYLKVAPRKDFAWANLARIHLKLGQKEQARDCANQMQDPEFQKLRSVLNRRIERE